MDVEALPQTKTRVGLVLADIGQALFLSRLRNVPDFEVGLLRAEFMLATWAYTPLRWKLRQRRTGTPRPEEDRRTGFQVAQDHPRTA